VGDIEGEVCVAAFHGRSTVCRLFTHRLWWCSSCVQIAEVADICCNGRLVSVLEGGYGTWHTHSKTSRSTGKLAPAQDEVLDRSVLAHSVSSHIRRLVDPYG
jgi:hypothetical protein